jgi:hypothetical protein
VLGFDRLRSALGAGGRSGGTYTRTRLVRITQLTCNSGRPKVRLFAMKPKASKVLAALAIVLQLVTGCSDQERFRGRTGEQVKQACDPQRQTPECSRTLSIDKRPEPPSCAEARKIA